MADKTCEKCDSPMQKHFATVSGNSKYLQWECEVCGNKTMQCTGVLK